mgnify:CR=1 FL=1
METKIIEARNAEVGNWGKFMVGRFDIDEWSRTSILPGADSPLPLLSRVGWGPHHIFVMDLQTGEGAIFRHGGFAPADLTNHAIWVCPLYEPFLTWLYQQDLSDLAHLPDLVDLDAPFEMSGYRRPGPQEAQFAEAQADLRALAEALQMHRTHGHTFHGCTGCESRRDNALARPGVRRLKEVKAHDEEQEELPRLS